ncbi:MAG: hypothetical protein JNK05_13220 [Myxococcales bacterium]|nr:hypothetical protein [Myxococcales bacterium]
MPSTTLDPITQFITGPLASLLVGVVLIGLALKTARESLPIPTALASWMIGAGVLLVVGCALISILHTTPTASLCTVFALWLLLGLPAFALWCYGQNAEARRAHAEALERARLSPRTRVPLLPSPKGSTHAGSSATSSTTQGATP